MKLHRIGVLLVATTVWDSSIAAPVYACTDYSGKVLYTNAMPDKFKCSELRRLPTQEDTRRFRESIKFGDKSTDGLILELKKPLALVQLPDGKKKWFRIDELTPVIRVESDSTPQ